ncbi:MAG TPA: ABC transporter permease [Kofleriaceae bacterium]|nr:ABC transporter permease [Kofleriaceae bacterium]
MSDVVHPTHLVEINAPVPFLAGPREMWRNFREYRHLIWNFIQRDIRLKYRDSSLGYFWSLLEPMGLSAVYWVLFVILAGKPQPKFALWVLIGVIVWGFFSQAVSDTLTSLTRNEGLIKQVYFPREIFALTNVGSKLILSALSLLVCIPLMVHFRIAPTPYLLMVPVGLALTAMLGLGIGLAMACLNVVNRDVDYFFRFVMRAGFFLSPVMWTVEQAGSRKSILPYLLYNPITLPLTLVRDGIDGHGLHMARHYIIYGVSFSVLTFLLGAAIFKRFESQVVKKL